MESGGSFKHEASIIPMRVCLEEGQRYESYDLRKESIPRGDRGQLGDLVSPASKIRISVGISGRKAAFLILLVERARNALVVA